jgi:hypothetical protein
MDEVTMVNLLDTICEKNTELSWKIKCRYSDGVDQHIMEVGLCNQLLDKQITSIIFKMESGAILRGRHKGVPSFQRGTKLIDALLEILHYESTRVPQLG